MADRAGTPARSCGILRRDNSGTPLVEALAHSVAELEQILGEQPD